MTERYIYRDMQELLKEAFQYFSVICLTGPRQSGKSTILKEMFPKAVKYSLKDVNVREFALNDPVAFLNQTKEMIFIDEVQKAPELFEYIQGMLFRMKFRFTNQQLLCTLAIAIGICTSSLCAAIRCQYWS